MGKLLLTPAILITALMAHDGHGGKNAAPAAAKSLRNPLRPAEISAETGKKLYEGACAGCHGSDGHASAAMKPRPTDIADHRMDSMTDGEIYWVITHGAGKAMPGFEAKLRDAERWQIVAHVRRLRKNH